MNRFRYLAALFALFIVFVAPSHAKESLVLLQIQGVGLDVQERDMLRAALQEGLSDRYKVYSGTTVDEKLKQAAKKQKKCDATLCLQEAAIAFQAELIGRGRALPKGSGYLLYVEIKNIFVDEVIYTKTTPCRNCDLFDVMDHFKAMGAGEQVSVSAPIPAIKKPTTEVNNTLEDASQGPEMISLKGGCYLMGSPGTELKRNLDERQHRVCVDDFSIGKFEVTQQQWQAVMGNNPAHFTSCDNCPVEEVSWLDVQDYINALNRSARGGYRLPTEAEWEYAARAGTTGPFSFSGKISDQKANYNADYSYDRSPEGKDRRKTTPVGRFPANPWGLHDVHGNVYEWTCSAYDGDYKGGETRCARGTRGLRVLRGGSWRNDPPRLRSANRHRDTSDTRRVITGFRLARSLPRTH